MRLHSAKRASRGRNATLRWSRLDGADDQISHREPMRDRSSNSCAAAWVWQTLPHWYGLRCPIMRRLALGVRVQFLLRAEAGFRHVHAGLISDFAKADVQE